VTPKHSRLIFIGLSILLVAPAAAWSFPTPLKTIRVFPASLPSPLYRPLFVASPPGDNSRLFIVEQRTGAGSGSGRIQILDLVTNTLGASPFLTTSGQGTTNEEGLLGLAFHPDFFAPPGNPNRAAFFIYQTVGTGLNNSNNVYRYLTTGQNPNAATADTTSRQLVISFSHPSYNNHNGGWIGFGPDGYLYIATGDGGSFCDPSGNAQNTNSYLGKIHRLDVSADQNVGDSTLWGYTSPAGNPFVGVAGLDEIWLYGLRNPWRNSFDRLTGALYIGDVGQDAREEVSYAGPGVSGLNFGWDIREGFSCSNISPSSCPSTCSTTGMTDPIWDYNQNLSGRCSITGGYVYRGSRIPDLQGTYFFADYCSGEIWSFAYSGTGTVSSGSVINRTTELAPGGGLGISAISSFGEDASGEIYLCDSTDHEIFKIVVNCAGSALAFTDHPDSTTVPACAPVSFNVALTDTRGALTYTWRKDFIPVPGAPNGPSLTIPAVLPADAGFYDVVVTDQCGSISSAAGLLTVSPPDLPLGDIDGDCDSDPGDVDVFVAVLLGLETDPGRVSRSDLNNDTLADGQDIQAMVGAQIP